MKLDEFQYELPERLIAQHPLSRRSDSRLLQLGLGDGSLRDRFISRLPELLQPGDLLVLNDTRVIPARLFAKKETGGKVEIMLERLLDQRHCLAQLKASKSPKPGTCLLLEDGSRMTVTGRDAGFFQLEAEAGLSLADVLERFGHMPLPPYIQRADEVEDLSRYQTVFANRPGAVAAPTAGLHFDEPLLQALRGAGVAFTHVTLHVGAGTFQPVRCERIEDHVMHAEYLEVGESTCEAVRRTRERGGRVIAVGTTAVRSRETAAAGGELAPYAGDSRLFIYPGFEFRVIDGLLTNFHLPGSTLLMLVSALAGRERILEAYQHAVKSEYRFFSYGDAMLIL